VKRPRSVTGEVVCFICGGDLPTEHAPTVNRKGAAMCDRCAWDLVREREALSQLELTR
jgi:hypothetical protein